MHIPPDKVYETVESLFKDVEQSDLVRTVIPKWQGIDLQVDALKKTGCTVKSAVASRAGSSDRTAEEAWQEIRALKRSARALEISRCRQGIRSALNKIVSFCPKKDAFDRGGPVSDRFGTVERDELQTPSAK
jgi:hypothetical protein